jgi:hypothetical protein
MNDTELNGLFSAMKQAVPSTELHTRILEEIDVEVRIPVGQLRLATAMSVVLLLVSFSSYLIGIQSMEPGGLFDTPSDIELDMGILDSSGLF